jgi:hypothetical protein
VEGDRARAGFRVDGVVVDEAVQEFLPLFQRPRVQHLVEAVQLT